MRVIEPIELNSWKDFPDAIEGLRQRYGKHAFGEGHRPNRFLYRGQCDAGWKLETTLERFSKREWNLAGYMSVAHACVAEVEAYTDKSWDFADWLEAERSLPSGPRSDLTTIPHYDYLVYLRHHGFPSPLLDWSASAYIAAFFAFEENMDVGRVAVFVYVETPEGTKGGPVGIPEISVYGPHVRTDKRHFLQQAWYTVASEFRKGKHYFVPHEGVFDQQYYQDVLVKITIPVSERPNALRSLYEYNITRFSLFQTEEALVRTLAFKELEEEYEF